MMEFSVSREADREQPEAGGTFLTSRNCPTAPVFSSVVLIAPAVFTRVASFTGGDGLRSCCLGPKQTSASTTGGHATGLANLFH